MELIIHRLYRVLCDDNVSHLTLKEPNTFAPICVDLRYQKPRKRERSGGETHTIGSAGKTLIAAIAERTVPACMVGLH